MLRRALIAVPSAGLALALFACGGSSNTIKSSAQDALNTATPIKHLVVIYGENISFDHYFGTYPKATNPSGEPDFHALHGTPSVNNLTEELLTHNQNLDAS